MYIAFKWLIGLTVAMWLSICGIDELVKRSFEIKQEGFNHKVLDLNRNVTAHIRDVELERDKYFKHISDKPHGVAFMPCVMFLAGALVVSMYNRKNEIILLTRRKFSVIDKNATFERLQEYSKVMCDFLVKYAKMLWIHTNDKLIKVWKKLCAIVMRKGLQRPRINIILLKKLQEIGEERKNLGQLLIAAIHENKNIRMQYELESMAKNRLAQHIENTQKIIQENRSRYVSFQHLYLVTHQENLFLKSQIKKLIKEKNKAEKNLFELMNEVYKSKNNQLKSFCSRYIEWSNNNLLNTDVAAEIQKFLDQSRSPVATTSNWQLTECPDVKVNATNSCPKCANPQLAEIIQDDILVPLISDAPKLKGLPGECVWTVKDKDGLIEKLYEYDYETDLDDGDTIRRIRQYSVYYDKDCLLDFSNSRTVINETRTTVPRQQGRGGDMDYPITTQGFLTGSEAFQKFMQNNINVVSNCTPKLPNLISNCIPRLPRPSLLSG